MLANDTESAKLLLSSSSSKLSFKKSKRLRSFEPCSLIFFFLFELTGPSLMEAMPSCRLPTSAASVNESGSGPNVVVRSPLEGDSMRGRDTFEPVASSIFCFNRLPRFFPRRLRRFLFFPFSSLEAVASKVKLSCKGVCAAPKERPGCRPC